MQSMTIIEDGERARSLCVRGDGDVRVFDRTFNFRADISCAGTTWQILTRIAPHIDLAELRAIEIERLAERCPTGWRPTSDAIDPDVPQRKLRRANFSVALLHYPDHPEFLKFSRARILTSAHAAGRERVVTGENLRIDGNREFAMCEDCFWRTPEGLVAAQSPDDDD
jgi:hypothetical protein